MSSCSPRWLWFTKPKKKIQKACWRLSPAEKRSLNRLPPSVSIYSFAVAIDPCLSCSTPFLTDMFYWPEQRLSRLLLLLYCSFRFICFSVKTQAGFRLNISFSRFVLYKLNWQHAVGVTHERTRNYLLSRPPSFHQIFSSTNRTLKKKNKTENGECGHTLCKSCFNRSVLICLGLFRYLQTEHLMASCCPRKGGNFQAGCCNVCLPWNPLALF